MKCRCFHFTSKRTILDVCPSCQPTPGPRGQRHVRTDLVTSEAVSVETVELLRSGWTYSRSDILRLHQTRILYISHEVGSFPGTIPVAVLLCSFTAPAPVGLPRLVTMPKGLLEVQLVGAEGLKDPEVFGRSDPYALLTVGRKPAARSRTAEDHGTRPVWNEHFTFNVDEGDSELHIRILNENTLSTDDDIGSAVIPLGLAFSTGKAPLQSYPVIRPSGRPQGVVKVSLTFGGGKDKAAKAGQPGYPQAGYPQAGYPQAGQPYPPPPGHAAYPQGGVYVPPPAAYPPPGGAYPPQSGAYPPQGGAYTAQGAAYPSTASYPAGGAPPSSYPAYPPPAGYPDKGHASYPPDAYSGKPPKDQHSGAYPAQGAYYAGAQAGYPPQGYPPQGYPPQPYGAAPHGYPQQPHGYPAAGHDFDKHKEGKDKKHKEGKEGKEGKDKDKYKEGKDKDKYKEGKDKHKYEEGHYGAAPGYAPYGYPHAQPGQYAPVGYPADDHYYGDSHGKYKEGKYKEGKEGKDKKKNKKKKEGLIEGILGMGIF